MTNNQQLAAHCRDVIANPQDHLDWVVDMARVALSALTQPAIPVFKLPEIKKEAIPFAAHRIEAISWNRCIAEFKRLNAPHTAQIEPICATGGAEWVKCSDRMPVIGENCWRTPLPVLVMCELGIIPAYARTYTTLSGEKKVGFAASLVFGNNDGDQPESLYSSEILTQATMWREMPAGPTS